MTGPGHNQPPSALELAKACFEDVGAWLKTNPVVQTEEDARAAKVILDRGTEALREVEQERDAKVRPLNEQVAEINAQYKALHNTDKTKPALYDRVINQLKERIRVFMEAEEQKRLAALEVARLAALEAERKAREAEAKEREAIEDAKMGVETDVVAATTFADQAFEDFAKVDRAALRAERDAKVKVAGGFGRALGFKKQEVLSVENTEDAMIALEHMGLTDGVRDAILTAARDYRKSMGELPPGITVTHKRSI